MGGSLLIWLALFFFNEHLSAPSFYRRSRPWGRKEGEEVGLLPRGLQQLYLHLNRAPATSDSSSPPPAAAA